MKKIEKSKKNNLFKKIFIKICRIIGFEIIDQSNFNSPTLGKELNDTLSIQGKKSITIPLGQIDLKKRVQSFKIILRTCTFELIMDQNKRRIFDFEKNEYTFRTLRSLIKATNKAKEKFEKINFELIVTDTNSPDEDLKIIEEILKESQINTKVISINLNEYKDKIKRNVEHLEIIKAYKKEDETTSIWTSEDFTAIDKAVVDGKKVYS